MENGFGRAEKTAMRSTVFEAAKRCELILDALPAEAHPAEVEVALLCANRILARDDLRVYERAIVEKLRATALGRTGNTEQAHRLFTRLMKTRGMPSGFYARIAEAHAAMGDSQAERFLHAREEGGSLPVTKVAPSYPKEAAQKEIEGCVVVEFTIEETGRTSNLGILRARPEGVFEQAALKAARQFRYSPPVYDGGPVKQFGVRYMFVFQLAERAIEAQENVNCA